MPTTSTKDSLNSNGEVYYCGNEKNPIFCPPCWYMKMNLREALHMVELRTIPQGHPDYRFICQEIWRKIQEVHPVLAECGKFIDWKKYRLGRLQSEMRTEFKRSGFEK